MQYFCFAKKPLSGLIIEEGTQPERVTSDYFWNAFLNKYLGATYVEARRRKFMGLTQGEISIAEYKVEFLRLRRYALCLVESNYDKSIRFKEDLTYFIKVSVAS